MNVGRPLLIAECCQNHQGSRETLKRMIHAAAENGADYVKIQALYSADVTFRERFEEGVVEDGRQVAIQRPYAAEVERLATLDLNPDEEAWFVDEAWRAGVAPMVTVFTRAAVERIGPMGFEAVKVASYDCRSLPLLADLQRHWARLFVSTGATYDHEIAEAADTLAGTDTTFLHCVTIYPTPLDQLHLRRMHWLRRFSPTVGFSDHTRVADTGLRASLAALALGADVIERHFTVLDPGDTKDGPVSIDPAQLAELRAFADRERPDRMAMLATTYPEWEQSLGQAQRELSDTELLNRDYYAGRVASRVGEELVYNWESTPVGAS
jgi:N,N'-diacetyllegionaminate synthase